MPVVDLPGWAEEDHAGALAAFQAGCGASVDAPGRSACAKARAAGRLDEPAAKAFLEKTFVAETTGETGMLTGYFAPEYEAQEHPDEIFSAPVRPRPDELVKGSDGRFSPWLERAQIERTPGPALAYMRPEDLFFLQIQGSGYLTFPDGRRLRAGYAADNGRPFVGVAAPMIAKGLLPRNGASGEAIRNWLATHRGADAEAITDLNPRYVFFVMQSDDGGQPQGASGYVLTPGRSGAIDPSRHGWGELLWIDAEGGNLHGAIRSYRRLITALDTGGAIRGQVRVDLYVGRGDEAGYEAGRIRHPLKLWRLVPAE